MTDLPTGQVICGDCMEVLPTLPEGSVHCVVTSPPYFALRSYLDKDHPDKGKEIGSEVSPEAFIETMVAVFREVRRVLRDDGCIFVNLGDSYSGGGRGAGSGKQATNVGSDMPPMPAFEPPGNLLNIPHRVAEALRADGWIWRQTIVWAKRSPMPESVQGWRWQRCRAKVGGSRVYREGNCEDGRATGSCNDRQAQWSDCPGCPKCTPNGGYVLRRGSGRCTTAHEYIFILTKGNRYFWDSEQSKEEALPASTKRMRSGFPAQERDAENHYREGFQRGDGYELTTRNPRSVWTLSSEPTSEHHFATFPSELVRRCLSASVSGGGCCPECGAPWAPVVESENIKTRPGTACKEGTDDVYGDTKKYRSVSISKTIGYRPTCDCIPKGKTPALERVRQQTGDKFEPWSVPCTVLDPFAGLCTVAQVARHMGHNSISIELNPKYVEIAKKRIQQTPRYALRQGAMQAIDTKGALLFDDLSHFPLDVPEFL